MIDWSRRPPAGPPRLYRRVWRVAAVVAAEAAVVLRILHHSAQFVAAGVLAGGTAIAAAAEARFRVGSGRSSDLANVLAGALALATILMCLLGLAAGHRPR